MSVSFLCNGHREWMYMHSEDAMPYVERAHLQGEWLTQNEHWREAIPFLGSAYESVMILLEVQGLTQIDLLARLTGLATSLVNCYQRLRHPVTAADIIESALQRIDVAICLQGDQEQMAYLYQCRQQLIEIREEERLTYSTNKMIYGLH